MHFDSVLFIVYIIYMHEAIAVSVSQCTYLSVSLCMFTVIYDLNRTSHGMDIIYTIFQIKIQHLVIYIVHFFSTEIGGYYTVGSQCSVNFLIPHYITS